MNFLELQGTKEESNTNKKLPQMRNLELERSGSKLNNLAKSGGLDEIAKIFDKLEESAWEVVKKTKVKDSAQLAEVAQYARVVSEVIKRFRNEVNKAITAAREAQASSPE